MAELEPAQLPVFGLPIENAFLDAVEIRNALKALAQTFYTTEASRPSDARQGMQRVNAVDPTNIKLEQFINSQWRTILQRIDAGIPAPVKQIVEVPVGLPITPWVVDHNLGSQVSALVFDIAFLQLVPVNVFQPRNIPLVRLDTSLGIGPVLTGYPLEFNGDILTTFAVVEGIPLGGGGPLNVDFVIDQTPSGGAPVPVTGGTIVLGPTATGVVIPGAPVTATNVFTGTGATPDLLNVLTTGAPLAGGIVQVWIKAQRTLNPGEYRLTQVNENRITIDHPVPTSGFVVLVG